MSVSTNGEGSPRIPLDVAGIQVNFCKNPNCLNFGVPASSEKQPRGPGAGERGRDNYRVSGGTHGGRISVPVITCLRCNEAPPLKSNQGVNEERERMAAYLAVQEPSCPGESCPNRGVGVSHKKGSYQSFGTTAAGSPRFRCLLCRKTFSVNVSKPAKNHQLPHKNSEVYSMLVNSVPMRRICKIAGISQKTLYDKVRFIHRQAMAFVARRERRLLTGEVRLEKLYLSVDRQDHLINWTNRKDKRQTQFQALGTADNDSSYVFAIHLNYDPSLKPEVVEMDAVREGDYDLKAPFRRHARVWLLGEYAPAVVEKLRTAGIRDEGAQSLQQSIAQIYREAVTRTDVEACDLPAEYTRFPVKGMQVHAEYTLYGHFYFLRDLLRHTSKLRFFLDQESGIRAACLAAFHDRILARECDAFYVSINKTMTNDEKERAMRDVDREIRKLTEEYPYDLSTKSLRHMHIARAIRERTPMGPWRDMWVNVLTRIKSEPEKKVCHLTDFNDYDDNHLAALMDKASLHGIDRFFAQVRNSLSLLARAPSSASNAGRVWYQRNAYDPEVAAMILDIYRVHYNYLEVGDDKKTPAMRLGLAKGKVRLTEIMTFEGD